MQNLFTDFLSHRIPWSPTWSIIRSAPARTHTLSDTPTHDATAAIIFYLWQPEYEYITVWWFFIKKTTLKKLYHFDRGSYKRKTSSRSFHFRLNQAPDALQY